MNYSLLTTSAGFSTLDLYTCHPTQRTITIAIPLIIDKYIHAGIVVRIA